MPRYLISHVTSYDHAAPVSAAWQALRLEPREEPDQACEGFDLAIDPAPSDLAVRRDYFGNRLHTFTVRASHARLEITSRCRIRRETPRLPEDGATPTVADAREFTATAIASGADHRLDHFLQPSPLVPAEPAAFSLAPDGRATPLLAWLRAAGEAFSASFAFDPSSTDVTTPLAEVLRMRRGVCQDFAHLMISCLRQHGIPAAYVSGYLLTKPPPGQARLRGADASHAWVSIFVPGSGWIDYDPTNACFVGDGHIVVARGRDYSDVSPVKGVFSGGNSHVLRIGVTVEAVADAACG